MVNVTNSLYEYHSVTVNSGAGFHFDNVDIIDITNTTLNHGSGAFLGSVNYSTFLYKITNIK